MLLRMAAPISLGMMSTFLFQIVDTYFVGRLGSPELAALAFSSTAYLVFVSVFMGLSVGVSSVVAKAAGSGDMGRAQGLAVVSLGTVLVLSVGLSVLARAAIGPMFAALGASDEVLPLIGDYMGILYLSFSVPDAWNRGQRHRTCDRNYGKNRDRLCNRRRHKPCFRLAPHFRG